MGATINGTNVVSKTKNAVGIGIRTPLQGSLHLHSIFFRIHINNVWVKGVLLLIHVRDIFLDAAFVEVDLLMGITGITERGFALIAKHNLHATIQVGQFSQTG